MKIVDSRSLHRGLDEQVFHILRTWSQTAVGLLDFRPEVSYYVETSLLFAVKSFKIVYYGSGQ
jgi:hypothetical protein